jgi:hypothetical protein
LNCGDLKPEHLDWKTPKITICHAWKNFERKFPELGDSTLDERSRRQWAGTETEQYGRGGLAWVCEATGMSHNTVKKGAIEITAR